jgi:hypothetical protein
MTEERLAELMVKAVDGIATPLEKDELMSHIADKPELYREYETQASLKVVTDGWVQRLELDAVEDAHEGQELSKLERGFGASLLLIGIGLLCGGTVYEVLMDPEAPMLIKAGISLLSAGTLILIGSVIRWKYFTSKADRYTEVVR